MNNQQEGYVFAQKVLNNDVEYPNFPGNNPLRDNGYAYAMSDLAFEETVYGGPQYGLTDYDGGLTEKYVRWVFTSSLTQSFYNANPRISPSETLFVLEQNYIPTASLTVIPDDPDTSDARDVSYKLYIPILKSYTGAGWQPASRAVIGAPTGTPIKVSFEYYAIQTTTNLVPPPGTAPNALETSFWDDWANDGLPLDKHIFSDITNLTTSPSGTISFTTASNGMGPWYIRFRLKYRALQTGSILVLRNLSITYPVDISLFEPFAQTQDLHLQTSAGMTNARYNGCKMTSPDFNIDSPDTVDGGPVVTITPVNPKSPTIGSSVPKNRVSKPEIQKPGFVSGKGNFKIK